MSEPSVIADVLRDALKGWNSLSGKTLLIFSGPTHEPLDPVRYLSNHSSGKMGQALAEVALDQGASVHLVTGPVDTARLPRGRRLEITQVHRAAEMLAEGRKHFKKADGVIFAAAVADFAPRETASDKAPKKQGKLSLDLKLNPDIAKTLCASKNPRQKVFGFALETGRGLASATRKLKEKHLDGIVLNGPETFGADFGDYQMILAGGKTEVRDLGRLTKRQLARHILKVMFPPAK